MYKCVKCGWSPEESSFYKTTSDIQIILNHEKLTCPQKRGVYDGTYK